MEHKSSKSTYRNFECNDAIHLNFTGGMDVHCSNRILSLVDREKGGSINTKCKSEEVTELERLQAIKRSLHPVGWQVVQAFSICKICVTI